jgi:hypothetical protein
MREKLEEIYQHTIPHSAFLSKGAIDSCMYQSFMLGKQENTEQYNKLKKTFLSLLEDWDNRNLNGNQTKEDWKKEAGLL